MEQCTVPRSGQCAGRCCWACVLSALWNGPTFAKSSIDGHQAGDAQVVQWEAKGRRCASGVCVEKALRSSRSVSRKRSSPQGVAQLVTQARTA